MTLILRFLKDTKIYDKFISKGSPDWLTMNDVEADFFRDIGTNNNSLSLWEIDDQKTTLNRIVAAYASKKNTVQAVSYILIDKSELDKSGLKQKKTKGDTPDNAINKDHISLIELTALKLMDLAKLIKNNASTAKEINNPDVAVLINESISNGFIKINDRLQKDLNEYIS
jgi:hypothetical protein